MGADGHFQLLRKSDWDDAFPDVQPEEIGAHVRTILGIECVTAYHDTNDIDDFDDTWSEKGFTKAKNLANLRSRLAYIHEKGEGGRYKTILGQVWVASEIQEQIDALKGDPDLPHSQRCKEALDWFTAKAETITVWT